MARTARFAALALLAAAPAAQAAIGGWDGMWFNDTFGSQGRAYFLGTASGSSATLRVDLDGNVFGGANPLPFTLSATIDGMGDVVISGANPPLYSGSSGSIDADGTINVDLTGAGGGAFSLVEIRGTWTPAEINATYKIYTGATLFAQGRIEASGLCIADLDGNGALNLDDIEAFATGFLTTNPAADLNLDGAWNLDDIDAFAFSFLAGCP